MNSIHFFMFVIVQSPLFLIRFQHRQTSLCEVSWQLSSPEAVAAGDCVHLASCHSLHSSDCIASLAANLPGKEKRLKWYGHVKRTEEGHVLGES